MALIDDFLPAMAFAALLASETNLAETSCEVARKDMDRLLDQALARTRPKNPAQADNALFAVCAFADEAILASSWPGRFEWMRRKLQQERFNTANAGEEFYERLASLSSDLPQGRLDMSIFENMANIPEEDQREALEVYAACLTLGFRGKHHDQQGMARVEELARNNIKRLHADRPVIRDKVFPEMYANGSLTRKKRGFLPAVALFVLFSAPAIIAAGIYATYAGMLSTFVNNWLKALG